MVFPPSPPLTISLKIVLATLFFSILLTLSSFKISVNLRSSFLFIFSTALGCSSAFFSCPKKPCLIFSLPNTFKLEIKTTPYKEPTIAKEIQSFINDGLKGIHNAEELLPEEAIEYLPTSQNYTETLA